MSQEKFEKFMDTSNDCKVNSFHLERNIIAPSVKELNSKSCSLKNVDYEKIYDETDSNSKKKREKPIKSLLFAEFFL